MENIDPRIIDQFNLRSPFTMEEGKLLFLGRVGSHSHGTYIPSDNPDSIDDVDYMGVICPPRSHVIGLDACGAKRWQTTTFQIEELDCVFYSWFHYIHLITHKKNPNVLGLLYLSPENIIYATPEWETLVEECGWFSSKDCLNTYLGMSRSHYEKMKGGGAYKGYMGERRKALVDKYGIDTKDAAHMIRILKMGIEFFDTWELNVDRTGIDADFLKDVKSGKYPRDFILNQWTQLEADLIDAHKHSPLPDSVDLKVINEIVEEITSKVYGLAV